MLASYMTKKEAQKKYRERQGQYLAIQAALGRVPTTDVKTYARHVHAMYEAEKLRNEMRSYLLVHYAVRGRGAIFEM